MTGSKRGRTTAAAVVARFNTLRVQLTESDTHAALERRNTKLHVSPMRCAGKTSRGTAAARPIGRQIGLPHAVPGMYQVSRVTDLCRSLRAARHR